MASIAAEHSLQQRDIREKKEHKQRTATACCCTVLLLVAGFLTWSFVADLPYWIVYGRPIESSDIWDMELKSLSCGFGFDNIINVPFDGDSNDPADLRRFLDVGGAYVADRPTADLDNVEYLTCAAGGPPANLMVVTAAITPRVINNVYSVFGRTGPWPNYLDGTPWCFSWPYLASTLDPTDIKITLNTGEELFPSGVSPVPNNEDNERHCIVLFTDLGNRIAPNATNGCARRADATERPDSCAYYPAKFELVGDITFIGPPEGSQVGDGPWSQDQVRQVNGKGITHLGWPDGPHPYIQGPTLIGAHLTAYSARGDFNNNDCEATFPLEFCQYRLRFYYSGGYTPNGMQGIMPTDFQRYWRLVAQGEDGTSEVLITETGIDYAVNGGTVKVIGLSELGQRMPPVAGCGTKGGTPPGEVDSVTGGCYDRCYNEDHDNYIDIILTGSAEGMRAIKRLEQPADGSGCYREFYDTGVWRDCEGYQPVYNPGGGGNVVNPHPYFRNYVKGSLPNISIDVVVDLENRLFVSYDDGMFQSALNPIILSWVLWALSFLAAGYVYCVTGRAAGPDEGMELAQS